MINTNQTAAVMARVNSSLVSETRAALYNLLRPEQERTTKQCYQHIVSNDVGHVQLAVSNYYIPFAIETVDQTLCDCTAMR